MGIQSPSTLPTVKTPFSRVGVLTLFLSQCIFKKDIYIVFSFSKYMNLACERNHKQSKGGNADVGS